MDSEVRGPGGTPSLGPLSSEAKDGDKINAPPKAVTIFDEPEHIAAPTYETESPKTIATSPKLHRASISGKKMTGRPNIQSYGSSTSLSKVPSYLALDDDIQGPGTPPGSSGTMSSAAEAKLIVAQVAEWLSEQKRKNADRPDLGGLEQILAGTGTFNLNDNFRPSRKSSTVSLKGSLLKKSHRKGTVAQASSDTEWVDGDINVPHVEAALDNSKTLAFTGGEADIDTSDAAQQKDQKYWDQFKQDIVRLTHTLRIRGWRRVPIDKGSLIHVERLSGALTNAVYVVRPPKSLPEPEQNTEGSRPYRSTSKPLELLLRIYGPQVEHLIDREEELSILRRLARKKIGPRLLGYFTNGRFEEFLHAKTLTAEDLRVAETSKQIAKRMRELHDGIELLPSERESGPRAWLEFDKRVGRCETVVTWLDNQVKMESQGKKPASKRYTKHGFICGVEWPVFRKAYEKSRERLLQEYGGQAAVRSRLVFAHNDTQYGNLMRLDPPGDSPLVQPANQHRQLIVIDFEYACANARGYEFANHFAEWCYNYHHPEKSYACNTNYYPTPAEQYRFMRAYVMHRPQFAPAASSTPKMEGREKTNISDFMLDARIPGGSTPIDYDAEERAREEKMETDIQALLRETKIWRMENSAQWVAWGIVQAAVPELEEPKQSMASHLLDKIKNKLIAHSDPLDADVKAIQEASKHDRPEGRDQEEAHAEGEGVNETSEEEEVAEDFDYLAYAQERAMFFWGDCLQAGIVQESELPEELVKKVKLVRM